MKIMKKDLENHGYSDGCRGCHAIRRGATGIPHSEECRLRIMTAMQTTPTGADRVRKSGERQRAHVDRAIEKDEEQATKRQRVAAEGGEPEVDQRAPSDAPIRSPFSGIPAPSTPILVQHPDPDDQQMHPVQHSEPVRLPDPVDDTMNRADDPGGASSTAAPHIHTGGIDTGGASSSTTPGPSATEPREQVHLERRGEKVRIYTKDSNVDMAAVGDNGERNG
jgi:hypothetical protein